MKSSQLGCDIQIHYNEQNLQITERMRAGNEKQVESSSVALIVILRDQRYYCAYGMIGVRE